MILETTDEILGQLERGELARDFATSVQEVLQAIADLGGGKGSVSLKLTFDSKGEMVMISSKLESSIPKKPRKTSNFFVTGDGRLSLQHPAQIDIFSRRTAVEEHDQ